MPFDSCRRVNKNEPLYIPVPWDDCTDDKHLTRITASQDRLFELARNAAQDDILSDAWEFGLSKEHTLTPASVATARHDSEMHVKLEKGPI